METAFVNNKHLIISDSDSSSSEEEEELTVDCRARADSAGIPPSYFGNIEVKNSSQIRFGNTTVYNGGVTVQQYVSTTPTPAILDVSTEENISPSGGSPDDDGEVPSTNDESTDRSSSCKRKSSHPHGLAQQLSIVVTKSAEEEEEGVKSRTGLLVLGGGCLLASIVLLAVLVGLGLGGAFSSSSGEAKPRDSWDGYVLSPYDENVQVLNGSEGSAPLYARIDWLAQPVRGGTPLQLPVPLVIISHSATNPCFNHSQCVHQMRKLQTFHIESKGWLDIGYNFVVGGDGGIYEGRGWDSIGAHAYGFNNVSIGISFVGLFVELVPPEKQMVAAKVLIEEGVKLGKIAPNYKLLAHRQVSATESPGLAFYKVLQTWPHWASLNPDTSLKNITTL